MGDKALPPIRKKKEEDNDERIEKEKWVAKNWDFFKKDEKSLKKMPLQMKSKYMAYEDPPKDIEAARATTVKRLTEKKKASNRQPASQQEEDLIEKENHDRLIGQLKAAEARNRIRIMRLRYEANRGQEVNHLIACQPTARKAVRLQALLPARPDDRSGGDKLDKLSRARVESLLDDTRGLLTGRT